MRPLIFLLVTVLALGMVTTLAVAADGCPDKVCPIELKSIANNIGVVVEVAAIGIVVDRQPIRKTVKGIAEKRLVQAKMVRRLAGAFKIVAKNTKTRMPARKVFAGTKRLLKCPLRGLCRRH